MKKVLIVAVIAMAAVACKKSYTCTVTMGGISASTELNDLTSSEAKDAKKACESGGGTWSAK